MQKKASDIFVLLSKFTGVDIVYFAKNGSFMIGERIFLIAKGFAISLLLANFVEKEVFGQYNFILSFLGILTALSLQGMPTAITQSMARSKEGTFYKGAKQMFRWGILGSLITLLTSIYFFFSQNDLWLIMIILIPVPPFYGMMAVWKSYYFGKENFFLSIKKSILLEFISFTALAAAILIQPKLFLLIFANIFLALIIHWKYVLEIIKKTKNKLSDISNLSYGKKLSFLYAIVIVSGYIDMIIVGEFVGFVELAGYAIAVLIPEQIKTGMRMLTTMTLPRFSKMKNNPETRKKIIKNVSYLFVLTTLAIFVYFLFSPLIFKWFFPKYTDFVNLSRFIALGFIFTPFLVFDSFFKAQKNEKAIKITTLISSLTSIALIFLLVPFFGIWGAATARISRIIIFSITAMILFLKNRPESLQK